MTQIQHKTLSRIRKMIKLAQDAGASEGERDNAMRAVHATLAKYNLSMSQVGASDPANEEPREILRQAFLGKPWALQISSAIARLYFCSYYYNTMPGNVGRAQKALHTFIGRHSNVVTAQEMSRFVVEAVNREAFRYQREVKGAYRDYRAFAQGAAMKIRFRVLEIESESKEQGLKATTREPAAAAEPEQPSSACTALVIVHLYEREEEANKQFMEAQKIELGKGRKSTFVENDAAQAAGRAFGASVSLHPQVSGAKQKRLK